MANNQILAYFASLKQKNTKTRSTPIVRPKTNRKTKAVEVIQATEKKTKGPQICTSEILDIESEGVEMTFRHMRDAVDYLNAAGLGAVGIAALAMPIVYALSKRLGFAAPALAYCEQSAIDSRKRVMSNPLATLLLDTKNWYRLEDGSIAMRKGLERMSPGEDPTTDVVKLLSAVVGRPLGDLREWHSKAKKVNARNWKPVDLVLKSEKGDRNTGKRAKAAVDLNGSVLHVMHNEAQEWWVKVGSKQLLSEVPYAQYPSANDKEAVEAYIDYVDSLADAPITGLRDANVWVHRSRQAHWKPFGVALIVKALQGAKMLETFRPTPLADYLNRRDYRNHPVALWIQKAKKNAGLAKLFQENGDSKNYQAVDDRYNDMRKECRTMVNAMSAQHFFDMIHWELVEGFEKDYNGSLSTNKPETMLDLICYEGGRLFKLLGMEAELACPVVTDEDRMKAADLVQAFQKPDWWQNSTSDPEQQRKQAEYRRNWARHHNAFDELAAMLNPNSDLDKRHVEVTGMHVHQCSDCRVAMQEALVSRVRTMGANGQQLNAQSNCFRDVLTAARRGMKAVNAGTKAEKKEAHQQLQRERASQRGQALQQRFQQGADSLLPLKSVKSSQIPSQALDDGYWASLLGEADQFEEAPENAPFN